MIDSDLFSALHRVAKQRLGPDHACTLALSQAVAKLGPDTIATVQEQLNALPPSTMTEMMAGAHKALRENPAALLDRWPGTNGPSH